MVSVVFLSLFGRITGYYLKIYRYRLLSTCLLLIHDRLPSSFHAVRRMTNDGAHVFVHQMATTVIFSICSVLDHVTTDSAVPYRTVVGIQFVLCLQRFVGTMFFFCQKKTRNLICCELSTRLLEERDL
jgi:hypothetical protein